jgi:hypothetical protein
MTLNFAYTCVHYFKSILDFPIDEINNETKNKILSQYELFDKEYKNISKIYNLKNCINFQYIKYTLISLNKNNPEFTITPIKIEIDEIQNELIHQSLLNKTICYAKSQITEVLFNKVCLNWKWFEKI